MVAALHASTARNSVGCDLQLDELETERLRLRLFVPEDLDALCSLTADAEVMRFIGDGVLLSRAEIEANLVNIISNFHRRGYGRWALEEKSTGRLAGYCGFGLSDEAFGVELVYLLGLEFWGRGYASEAGRACLRYGFEQLQLSAIKAVTLPDNLRSQRVMERLGLRFACSGVYRGYPCVVYEVRRDDWQAETEAFYAVSQRLVLLS
jgi:RimJ/RimL family protein N-acetyltransferase